MKKLKIGLFIDTFFPMIDGVINVVDNYAKRMCEFCDVTVFTLKPHGKCDRTYPYKVVQCKKMRVPGLDYDLPIINKKFKKALEASELDIVHIHSPFTLGKAGVKYAKKHNIPAVATMHSQYKQDFYKATKMKWLTNILLKKIMKVFNNCDEFYGVNAKISEIFYEYGAKHLPLVQKNGTDLTPVTDEKATIDMVNKKYNIPSDMPVFLFVGRINTLKNIFFTVEALSKMKNKYFKMIFVGDGQDLEKLKEKVDKFGLNDNIIITGRIMDRELIKALYLRAKLFLFPSLYDASSLVQIEASSQKTPTIFLEGSATSATVTHNVNGFICENSTDKFAEKIEEILANDDLYSKVSKGAVRDLYVTWDDCVKEMYEKYLEQIEKKKGEVKNEEK